MAVAHCIRLSSDADFDRAAKAGACVRYHFSSPSAGTHVCSAHTRIIAWRPISGQLIAIRDVRGTPPFGRNDVGAMRTLVERRERACFSILDGTSIDGVPGLPRPLKPPSDLRSFLGSYGSVGGFELMPVCAPHREQLSDKLMVNGYGRDYGKRLGHEPATTGTAMPTLIALTPEPLL